jgi:hypothetical protein
MRDRTRRRFAAVPALALLACCAAPARAQTTCPGDCNGDLQVTVDELVRGVDIALGTLPLSSCPAFDANATDTVEIAELIAAVQAALTGCAAATPTPTATPGEGVVDIATAVARDAQGIALHLGEQLTVEGVVTVEAGAFANSKLKVFAQQDGAGIMLYHQSSADVDAFEPGQRVRATGVIRQADPTGSGDNPATGTVLIDLTDGSWTVLDSGNPLPTPVTVTLAQLIDDGVALTGTLVRVEGLQKAEGETWPKLGDRSAEVLVGDGTATLAIRFQRPIITAELDAALAAIGDMPFTATAVAVQEDEDGTDVLLSGFQLWVRGVADIAGP